MSLPATWMPQMFAEPSAITRSGSACLSAPATAWGRKWPITWRAATGAGWRALRMLPAGAVMRIGPEGALVVRHLGAHDDLDAVGRVRLGVVHHHVDAAPALRRGAGVVDEELVAAHLGSDTAMVIGSSKPSEVMAYS